MTTDQIKTFEDACAALGMDPSALPTVSMLPAKHQKSTTAYFKLCIIAEALNEGWQPNWNNSDEYKYQPWFEIDADEQRPAGFGFSHADYDSWHTLTTVGSRLCFKTYELALYAGKQFADLYQDLLLMK